MVDAAHSTGCSAVTPKDAVAYLVDGATVAETRSALRDRVVHNGGVFDGCTARVVVNAAAMDRRVVGYQTSTCAAIDVVIPDIDR